MQGVAPLRHRPKCHETPKSIPEVRRQRPAEAPSKPSHPTPKKIDYYLSSHYQEAVYAHTILSFQASGLPTPQFRELKQGRLSWQARLDLHGFRSEAAEEMLLNFLSKQWDLGHRMFLIIHGKGGLAIETPPVLKNLLNHWLRQIPEVLAFHSALPKDGGTGAEYVLLRRNPHLLRE